MKRLPLGAVAAGVAVLCSQANATTITFDDLSVGSVLSNQYVAQGVTFAPNAFSGSGGPTGTWATNSNMTIVSATGSDIGGLGTPSLVSGNLLRSFDGWLGENGDPSFSINFSAAVAAVSLDFAGIATPSSSRMFIYDGATLLSTLATSVTTGQQRLSYSASHITRVVVTPGDFFDWVGVDNLTFTPVTASVPEPGTWALLAVGLLGVGAARRRAA